jgi:heme oxygenase
MKSSPSLRDSLRAGTVESHKNVDRVFSAFDLANRDDYALFLAAQAGALFAIESELERVGIATVVPDWQERRRSDDMREDLALFAVEPECVESPALASVDDMLAALYVLEGSRLGGKILVKQALASEDDRVRDATTFLRHGPGSVCGKASWRGWTSMRKQIPISMS